MGFRVKFVVRIGGLLGFVLVFDLFAYENDYSEEIFRRHAHGGVVILVAR